LQLLEQQSALPVHDALFTPHMGVTHISVPSLQLIPVPTHGSPLDWQVPLTQDSVPVQNSPSSHSALLVQPPAVPGSRNCSTEA
jgi:hypothetical protein